MQPMRRTCRPRSSRRRRGSRRLQTVITDKAGLQAQLTAATLREAAQRHQVTDQAATAKDLRDELVATRTGLKLAMKHWWPTTEKLMAADAERPEESQPARSGGSGGEASGAPGGETTLLPLVCAALCVARHCAFSHAASPGLRPCETAAHLAHK